jgi:hypothetical protein
VRRQVEADEFEQYMPRSAGDLARRRANDLVPTIEMMAAWYTRTGGTT